MSAETEFEEALFDLWWSLYRVEQWQKIRPDMGPKPSDGYLLGLKDTAKLGWMARAMAFSELATIRTLALRK